MKKDYTRPTLIEYGPAAELTTGGGSTSLDWTITTNPLAIGVTDGSGCATINGTPYGHCS